MKNQKASAQIIQMLTEEFGSELLAGAFLPLTARESKARAVWSPVANAVCPFVVENVSDRRRNAGAALVGVESLR